MTKKFKGDDLLPHGFKQGPMMGTALRCCNTALLQGRDHLKVLGDAVNCKNNPGLYWDNPIWADLAAQVLQQQREEHVPPAKDPIPYARWGEDIEAGAIQQMEDACALPVAAGAALMPDAHQGYGLPIGGVLATEDSVIPYAVGVDIACRMKITVTTIPVADLDRRRDELVRAIEKGTRFGVGAAWDRPHDHPVMDKDWTVSPVTARMKDTAWKQMGSSGTGNHFVEFGTVRLEEDGLGVPAGEYVALLSHSGSRGAGAKVCDHYSKVAKERLPKRYSRFEWLAWLMMDTEAGQEYWAAMNLMGEYAAANHACIHRLVCQLAGTEAVAGVENHHNFCWVEEHGGKKVYVHRKGATPAGAGVLGVIPGTMGDPCYIVRGRGQAASLNSSSHGAGRRMSRTKAKEQFNWPEWEKYLKERNVHLISAGLDEVPGAYKSIREVMAAQQDLVEVVGEFRPRIVKMSDDGKSED